ncbi:uncharacterized protein AMSG_10689 [Thecamonas trahens ATCC 50062]|uniref:Uncharacterized protein n=1 Tax=Thecamonas trahens ATCC 50062 TaxID=461836 RepID=A0A0L0DSA6_THETB|nr:hypothetical protein AMSG_10689 [Thecamonas trahens ATCC 50062]KNC55092.1 hypothetical protein AMSG_10689 [Thecamonas trahens ATCC 50062]|eukprot:XP_013753276.1 hypothetical protein AMSG_10689 [Thecamonas trahens ATCC 50062]
MASHSSARCSDGASTTSTESTDSGVSLPPAPSSPTRAPSSSSLSSSSSSHAFVADPRPPEAPPVRTPRSHMMWLLRDRCEPAEIQGVMSRSKILPHSSAPLSRAFHGTIIALVDSPLPGTAILGLLTRLVDAALFIALAFTPHCLCDALHTVPLAIVPTALATTVLPLMVAMAVAVAVACRPTGPPAVLVAILRLSGAVIYGPLFLPVLALCVAGASSSAGGLAPVFGLAIAAHLALGIITAFHVDTYATDELAPGVFAAITGGCAVIARVLAAVAVVVVMELCSSVSAAATVAVTAAATAIAHARLAPSCRRRVDILTSACYASISTAALALAIAPGAPRILALCSLLPGLVAGTLCALSLHSPAPIAAFVIDRRLAPILGRVGVDVIRNLRLSRLIRYPLIRARYATHLYLVHKEFDAAAAVFRGLAHGRALPSESVVALIAAWTLCSLLPGLVAGTLCALASHSPAPIAALVIDRRLAPILGRVGVDVIRNLRLSRLIRYPLIRARYATHLYLVHKEFDAAAAVFRGLAHGRALPSESVVALIAAWRAAIGVPSAVCAIHLELALRAHAPSSDAIPLLLFHLRRQLRAASQLAPVHPSGSEPSAVILAAVTPSIHTSAAAAYPAFPHTVQRLLWVLYGGDPLQKASTAPVAVVNAFIADAAALELDKAHTAILADVIRGPSRISPANSLLAMALALRRPWMEPTLHPRVNSFASTRSMQSSIVRSPSSVGTIAAAAPGLINDAPLLGAADDVASLVARALCAWLAARTRRTHPVTTALMVEQYAAIDPASHAILRHVVTAHVSGLLVVAHTTAEEPGPVLDPELGPWGAAGITDMLYASTVPGAETLDGVYAVRLYTCPQAATDVGGLPMRAVLGQAAAGICPIHRPSAAASVDSPPVSPTGAGFSCGSSIHSALWAMGMRGSGVSSDDPDSMQPTSYSGSRIALTYDTLGRTATDSSHDESHSGRRIPASQLSLTLQASSASTSTHHPPPGLSTVSLPSSPAPSTAPKPAQSRPRCPNVSPLNSHDMPPLPSPSPAQLSCRRLSFPVRGQMMMSGSTVGASARAHRAEPEPEPSSQPPTDPARLQLPPLPPSRRVSHTGRATRKVAPAAATSSSCSGSEATMMSAPEFAPHHPAPPERPPTPEPPARLARASSVRSMQHAPSDGCAARVVRAIHQRVAFVDGSPADSLGTAHFLQLVAAVGRRAPLTVLVAAFKAVAASAAPPFSTISFARASFSALLDGAIAAGVLVAVRAARAVAFAHAVEWSAVYATTPLSHAECMAYHIGRAMAAAGDPRVAHPLAVLPYARRAWDIALLLDLLAALCASRATRSPAYARERLWLLDRIRPPSAPPVLTPMLRAQAAIASSRYSPAIPTFAESFLDPPPVYPGDNTTCANAIADYATACLEELEDGAIGSDATSHRAIAAVLSLLAAFHFPPARHAALETRLTLIAGVRVAPYDIAAAVASDPLPQSVHPHHVVARVLLARADAPKLALRWLASLRPTGPVAVTRATAALAANNPAAALAIIRPLIRAGAAPAGPVVYGSAWLVHARALLVAGHRRAAWVACLALYDLDLSPSSVDGALHMLMVIATLERVRASYMSVRASLLAHASCPGSLALTVLSGLIWRLAGLDLATDPVRILGTRRSGIEHAMEGFPSRGCAVAATAALAADYISAADRDDPVEWCTRRAAVLVAAAVADCARQAAARLRVDENMFLAVGSVDADAPRPRSPGASTWILVDSLTIIAAARNASLFPPPPTPARISHSAVKDWLIHATVAADGTVALQHMLDNQLLIPSGSSSYELTV